MIIIAKLNLWPCLLAQSGVIDQPDNWNSINTEICWSLKMQLCQSFWAWACSRSSMTWQFKFESSIDQFFKMQLSIFLPQSGDHQWTWHFKFLNQSSMQKYQFFFKSDLLPQSGGRSSMNLAIQIFESIINAEINQFFFQMQTFCLRVEAGHQWTWQFKFWIDQSMNQIKTNNKNMWNESQKKLQPLNLLLFTFYLPIMAWMHCCWWNKASNMYVWSTRGKDCKTRRLRWLKRQDKTESALSQ